MSETPNPLTPPENLRKPVRDATILRERAKGASFRQAAKEANCALATAHAVAHQHEEWLAGARRYASALIVSGLDKAIEAQLTNASTPGERTGPQATRVLCEILGWIGKGGDVVLGDKVVASFEVDARTINFVGADLEQLAEASAG